MRYLPGKAVKKLTSDTLALPSFIHKEKAEIYLEAENLVVGNALIAPTYLEASPTYVKNYVKNYFVTTNGTVDFSQVSIEK